MLDDLDLAWEEQHDTRRRRGQPPSRQQRQRRRKERKRRRRSFGALFISLLLLVGLGGGVYWGVGWLQDTFGAEDYSDNPAQVEVNIVINPGDGATAIGQELFDKKVVASVKAFINAYAEKEEEARGIQPGTYKMYEHMPAKSALAFLLDPGKYMVVTKVTIPEGMISVDIFKKLSDASGIPVKEFETAAKDPVKLGVDESWFGKRDDGTPVRKSIEGFLFPATYSFQPDTSAQDMLKQMVATFMQVAEEIDFVDTARSKLQLSPYEALITASIIEKEAVLAEDYPKVARVLYNRAFRDDGPCDHCLGLDSTVNYWLAINGKKVQSSSELRHDQLHDPKNPYNTHDKPGLPPGAISNPGKATLLAALNPGGVGTDVFFFQTIDKEGHMAYDKTYAQHERTSQEACAKDKSFC